MKHKKSLVAGTFDNFHLGHQYLLWQVAHLSDFFVIIIARDKTVERIKKRLPENNELQRKARLAQEFFANGAVRLGRADADFFATIAEENPDVIFLGYDQKFDEKKCLDELFSVVRKEMKLNNCKRAILVGHNAAFDLNFLNACVTRIDKKRKFAATALLRIFGLETNAEIEEAFANDEVALNKVKNGRKFFHEAFVAMVSA